MYPLLCHCAGIPSCVVAAEDRILGFEIVAKADGKWRLHYDGAAQAATDVPDTVGKLIKQRRRWLVSLAMHHGKAASMHPFLGAIRTGASLPLSMLSATGGA